MQKSLAEVNSLPAAELLRLVANGPLLITDEDEPRLVAQSIEEFEATVRRLRELESALRRQIVNSAKVTPLPVRQWTRTSPR